MLAQLRKLFLQGIALLAPLALTVALIIWVGHSVETVVGAALRQVLPGGWYIPGLGLLAGILLTLAAGLLANLFLVRWLLNLMEHLLDRIPLIKSLFQGLKDVSRFFAQSGDKTMGRPVRVSVPLGDGEMQLVGFVMQDPARLPGPEGGDASGPAPADCIAVFLPMSYQMGGYTVYLHRDRISPLDVSPDDALRAVLTGGSLGAGPRREGDDDHGSEGDGESSRPGPGEQEKRPGSAPEGVPAQSATPS